MMKEYDIINSALKLLSESLRAMARNSVVDEGGGILDVYTSAVSSKFEEEAQHVESLLEAFNQEPDLVLENIAANIRKEREEKDEKNLEEDLLNTPDFVKKFSEEVKNELIETLVNNKLPILSVTDEKITFKSPTGSELYFLPLPC